MLRPFLLFGGGLLCAWAGVGCLVGSVRFRYWPLLILAFGYLAWSVAALGVSTLLPATTAPHALWAGLFVLGAVAIFGYRFTFYPKMRARGIHPKRLFGFGSG